MSRLYNRSRNFPSRLKEMAQIDLADENLQKLKQIQLILLEDGIEDAIVDEALARVLDFYRKFVPYN